MSVTAVQACGPDTDCMIGDRTFRLAMPPGATIDGPNEGLGAILFLHGYRGSADGAMRNASLRKVAEDLGVAFVAAKSGGEDWLIRNAPNSGFVDDEAELEYFDALLDQLAEYGIDREKTLVTGFSAGGMMTWTLACRRPDQFAAYVPVAGTFWAPMPEDCGYQPMKLLHIHGTSDTIVPLGGRPIADVRQGDVPEALRGLRDALGVDGPEVATEGPDDLSCTGTGESSQSAVTFCLHDGGHSFQAPWVDWSYRNLIDAP